MAQSGMRSVAEGPLAEPAEKAREIQRRYAGDEDRPLGSYVLLSAVYAAAVVLAALVLRARGQRLPDHVRWSDFALTVLATHRVSRLLTKDTIASPLRAPFTTYEGVSGPAELAEDVEGTGLRHAIGELLTCPFCMSQWVATLFSLGFLVAPDATRVAAGVFASVGLADVLHLLYGRLEQ